MMKTKVIVMCAMAVLAALFNVSDFGNRCA